MAKKAERRGGKPAGQSDEIANDTPEAKKTFLTPKRLETLVAVLLGVTTLLSAWAA